jgi:hypothetical protein
VVIRIVLVKLRSRFAITRLLHAQRAHIPTLLWPAQVHAVPPVETEAVIGGQQDAAWDVLDDRQLTRLLTNAAPRTVTE